LAAINAIPPVAYGAVDQAWARPVIGIEIRPPGHALEKPFAADTDPYDCPIVGCAVHRVAVVVVVADRTVIELGVHDNDVVCHNDNDADKMSRPANPAVAKLRNDRAFCDPLYPTRNSCDAD
jgi:hypothetical protein